MVCRLRCKSSRCSCSSHAGRGLQILAFEDLPGVCQTNEEKSLRCSIRCALYPERRLGVSRGNGVLLQKGWRYCTGTGCEQAKQSLCRWMILNALALPCPMRAVYRLLVTGRPQNVSLLEAPSNTAHGHTSTNKPNRNTCGYNYCKYARLLATSSTFTDNSQSHDTSCSSTAARFRAAFSLAWSQGVYGCCTACGSGPGFVSGVC